MKDAMVVSPRSTARWGFKCGCCQMHKAKARCGKGRDRERRMLKRRERRALAADLTYAA